MKRLITLTLAILLLVCCVACDEGDIAVSENDTSSKAEQSHTESKPWYDTSVPEGYSSQAAESKPQYEETTAEKEDGEGSLPDTENSGVGGTQTDYEQLTPWDAYFFPKDASGYRIVYTKTSPLNASDAVTNVVMRITAIYDGSVTRFFDATDGTFYHAVPGKYLYPCCDGFLAGDINEHNADYSVMFARVKGPDNESALNVLVNEHGGHGDYAESEAIYSGYDKKLFGIGEALSYINGQTYCRYYASTESLLDGYDKNIGFVPDESKLGKYGVASNEKIIVPFEYDYIVTAQGSLEFVGVYLAIKDGRSYYISSNGTVLTPEGFDCGSQPYGNRAWVFEDGQGYIISFY